ncbi:unnamed protein product [Allacma fusca]|uniref:Uncharacterized protein n=1 Tax=Allacma fusca TaxID=39272 RepID=A0A8J2KZM7_9HEXA|nr:unnamed protein product [Allacma fusca]
MESSAEVVESVDPDVSAEDEVAAEYHIDYALLFPLKASLFPVKSSSLLEQCGNRDTILRLVIEDCEEERLYSKAFGFSSDRRSSRRGSLLRRRSTSLPEDIDRLVSSPPPNVRGAECGGVNCPGKAGGLFGIKEHEDGLHSLPRINRSKNPRSEEFSELCRRGLSRSGLDSKGSCGSFGDHMNEFGYGSHQSINTLSGSQQLIPNVTLRTAPASGRRPVSADPSCPISAFTASLQDGDRTLSIPKLNVCEAESDGPLITRSSDRDYRFRTLTVAGRNRAARVIGIDEVGGFLVKTPDSVSVNSCTSVNYSPSPSLSHSSSFSDEEIRSGSPSIRINSGGSPTQVKITNSSSCCGVNLRRHESSPFRRKGGRSSPIHLTLDHSTSCPSLEQQQQQQQHHLGKDNRGARNNGSQSPGSSYQRAGTSCDNNRAETGTASFDKVINRSYLVRKNGVANNSMTRLSEMDTVSNTSAIPVQIQITEDQISSPCVEGQELEQEVEDEEGEEEEDCFTKAYHHSENVPTVERAKRLSRLIQNRRQSEQAICLVPKVRYISSVVRNLISLVSLFYGLTTIKSQI